MSIKKRILSSILTMSIISTMGVTAFAYESSPSVYTTDTKMVDNSFGSEKTTIAEPLEGTVLSRASKAPKNTSRVKWITSLIQTHYAVASSSSNVLEDSIYARCRTYTSSGSLIQSRSNTEKKSSYVTAQASSVGGNAYKYKAIGNHTYKLAGYKDVYHETSAYNR